MMKLLCNYDMISSVVLFINNLPRRGDIDMDHLTFVVVGSDLDYYIDLFLRIKQAGREAKTVAWYENALKVYRQETAHLPSDWPPTLEHCLAFIESFEARNLSEYSRDNYYRALRAFFNWCVALGSLEDSPLRLIDAPPTPHPLPIAPRVASVTRLLAKIGAAIKESDNWRYVRDLALFSLALDTGARIGEIQRLVVDQVNLLNQQIQIYATKTHRGRTLELGDEAAMDLAVWIERRARLQQQEVWPIGLNSLFVSFYQRNMFRPWTARGMRTRLAYWQRQAGVKHFTFNGFRHAYAVYSLRNKADLLDIKDQMGHTSIKTTARYTEVVDEERASRHRRTSPRGNL
jgi:integrase/recombinase XerD